MQTKEMSHRCCSIGVGHKKRLIIVMGIIVLAIIALGVASVGWKMRQIRNGGGMMYGASDDFGRGKIGNQRGGFYPSTLPADSANQFVLPQDALKSGEIAITVNNLETAKKAIADMATNGGGSVFATYVAYSSNSLKNGSIVVQVPVESFDATFGNLKKVGSQVVQESTRQIPPSIYYPMMAAGTSVAAPATDAAPAQDAKPEIAIYPSPVQPQSVQNKGYIKVIFVDYGLSRNGGEKSERIASSIISIGDPSTQDMRNNILVIVGIKIILLVIIFGLLIAIFKKIFHRIRRRKEARAKVHVVRQATKTRTRIVKVAPKKRK